MMGDGQAGWDGGFWMLGVIIARAVTTASRKGPDPTGDPSRSMPIEILCERFARGEITACCPQPWDRGLLSATMGSRPA